jgi:hypothetical protein
LPRCGAQRLEAPPTPSPLGLHTPYELAYEQEYVRSVGYVSKDQPQVPVIRGIRFKRSEKYVWMRALPDWGYVSKDATTTEREP